MIREKTNTGTGISFVYTKKDRDRIASEDTESSREVKQLLREWKSDPKGFKRRRKPTVINFEPELDEPFNPNREDFNIVDKPSGAYYDPQDYEISLWGKVFSKILSLFRIKKNGV